VPPRDWRLRVEDILNAVGRIERFTRGLVFETFANDERTIAAVSYELVVIGGAAKNVLPKPGQPRRLYLGRS
jgi:uncharacterized protein with HEPN domain